MCVVLSNAGANEKLRNRIVPKSWKKDYILCSCHEFNIHLPSHTPSPPELQVLANYANCMHPFELLYIMHHIQVVVYWDMQMNTDLHPQSCEI